MREVTNAEKHNINWLKSVVESPRYTTIFKQYVEKDLKRLESLE